jgi:hexosaminidase
MKKGFYLLILLALFHFFNGLPAYGRELPVLPYPQYVETGGDRIVFSANIAFDFSALERGIAGRLTDHWEAFKQKSNVSRKGKVTLAAGLIGKDKKFDLLIGRGPGSVVEKIGTEGYLLIWNKQQKVIAAHTEAGLFYALQSLKQLIRAEWDQEIYVADWPSFPHRIIYDDISRGPISTVDYIKEQIERMAELKINGLSFYIEHVVQPYSHPDFAPDSGKLTIPQVKELSAFAAKHHVQLIGSFQSFGHFEKILALPQYKAMGETSTLISPLDPKARAFLANVIGELCDAFSAPYFNVNCDETFDLAKGKSKKYIDSIGAARFYADHLKFLYDVVTRHNKKMMMWGDVALEHEEVLDMLPRDIIYLTWEYGDKPSYDQWILPFKKRGLQFMVCPGILNSYRMFPDMVMAKANIKGFINDAGKHQAKGVITTIWDDGGTYLFSADWYGVYVTADKSWNSHPAWEASFDARYERNAYGTDNGAYLKALHKLMELRSLPITYNLNDQVWRQKILPDSAQQLIVNNSSAKAARRIIEEADQLLAAANPKSHAADIKVLQFAIDQYKLIVDIRIQLARVAQKYKQVVQPTGTEPQKAGADLSEAAAWVQELCVRHQQLRERFKVAWQEENQPYWLNVVLAGYDQKINDLQKLTGNLRQAQAATGAQKPLQGATHVRLNIMESTDYYFQNWMLGGPFPFASKDTLPGFLYSEQAEYNKPPVPGDFTHYQGKTYRWQKFASQDGGVVDLDEQYQAPQQALAYAYCSITTEQAINVTAFFASDHGGEIFCNGEKVLSNLSKGGGEKSMQLSLKAGINHLLLKLPKKEADPWSFTFRLDKTLSVTTHKHKYQLNPKLTVYEAD